MTSEEKLKELFAAALRAPETNKITPQQPPQYRAPSTVAAAARPEVETPAPVAATPEPADAIAPESPMASAGLDHEKSAELARMLDEKEDIKKRRDRRNRVLTMAAAIAERNQALTDRLGGRVAKTGAAANAAP